MYFHSGRVVILIFGVNLAWKTDAFSQQHEQNMLCPALESSGNQHILNMNNYKFSMLF